MVDDLIWIIVIYSDTYIASNTITTGTEDFAHCEV